MKYLIAATVLLSAVMFAPSAKAQSVTTYYVAPGVVVAPPVYAAPVTTYYAPATTYYAPATTYYAPATTTYYAPAPTVTYRPLNATVYPPVTVYRPTVPVVTAPVPVVSGWPVYGYYSPYGGAEIRVPGQPIRNTFRAIIP